MSEDIKLEVNVENTRKVLAYLDNQLDAGKGENSLANDIKEDLDFLENKKKRLTDIAIKNINNDSRLEASDKLDKIKTLGTLSLEELEARREDKSESLEEFENKSIRKLVSTFSKTYKGNKEDIEDDFNTFLDKKSRKVIDESIESSDIFKKYKEKLSEYNTKPKKDASMFTKILDFYANLPNKVLEAGFKDVMREDIKNALARNKEEITKSVKGSVERNKTVSKSKSKGAER